MACFASPKQIATSLSLSEYRKKRKESEKKNNVSFRMDKRWDSYLVSLATTHTDTGEPPHTDGTTPIPAWDVKQTVPVMIERPMNLQNGLITDSFYFSGMSSDGCGYTVMLNRRKEKTESWVFLKIPEIGGSFMTHNDPSATKSSELSHGGLKISCMVPLRHWLIEYDGKMKKIDGEEEVRVRLKLRARDYTETCTVSSGLDLSSHYVGSMWQTNELTSILSQNKSYSDIKTILSSDPPETIIRHNTMFCESKGNILIGLKMKTFCTRGLRYRSCGVWGGPCGPGNGISTPNLPWVYSSFVLESGWSGQLVQVMPLGIESLVSGILHSPLGFANHTTCQKCSETDHPINIYLSGGNIPVSWTSIFSANNTNYEMEVTGSEILEIPTLGEGFLFLLPCLVTATMKRKPIFKNEKMRLKGNGFVQFYSPVELSQIVRAENISITENSRPNIVNLSDLECRDVFLVGGKGAQLSCLVSLEKTNKNLFSVPNGYVITSSAHDSQVSANTKLSSAIANLTKNNEITEKDCNTIYQLYIDSDMNDDILKEITEFHSTISSGSSGSSYYAVRSSAISEDSQDASSAGQMDTFLGISDINDIVTAVKKCWASQYNYRAVMYRVNRGVAIRSSMGVVVQNLVLAESSGVLFSINPFTGSKNEMILNANYGLGESVVSGICNPDTFVVNRQDMEIHSSIIGSKEVMVVKKEGESDTENVPVKPEMSKVTCISDQNVKDLCKVALIVELEQGYGCDIEWAIIGSKIYLLQVRPVTTSPTIPCMSDTEKIFDEYDVFHEFDTALSSEQDWLTTSNIGEMFPGAITPLSQSVFGPGIEYGIGGLHWYSGGYPLADRWYSTGYNGGHAFINITSGNTSAVSAIGPDLNGFSINILGRIEPKITWENVYTKAGTFGFMKRLKNAKDFYGRMVSAGRDIRSLEKRLESFERIGDSTSDSTSKSLWNAIDKELGEYHRSWLSHIAYSGRSGMWSTVFMQMLTENYKKEVTPEIYADIADLLKGAGSAVESVSVPSAINSIAAMLEPSFGDLSPSEGLKWLQEDKGKAGDAFKKFMKRNGHRCIKEAELRQPSWSQNPIDLVPIIQASLRNNTNTSIGEEKYSSFIPTLRTTGLSTTTMMAIRNLVPRARNGVAQREWGKSLAVRHQQKYKEAYMKLSELLFQEQLIPDSDLMYFMTHREIGKLCGALNMPFWETFGLDFQGQVVTRALLRRSLFDKQNQLEYLELGQGVPIPINEKETILESSSITNDLDVSAMSGLPICAGKVEAKARVIMNLNDAASLEPGEIMICKYTDVGWSPYFPLCSGLVTELGAILSHGAVVARECGIPCIVGMKKATRAFRTGDLVQLDGGMGTLTLVERI